jgi:hypothetical protein
MGTGMREKEGDRGWIRPIQGARGIMKRSFMEDIRLVPSDRSEGVSVLHGQLT